MINFILVEEGGICLNQESYTNVTQILNWSNQTKDDMGDSLASLFTDVNAKGNFKHD